ncbi:MAG TPA: long-chain-fatty-acid--CoA ligase [Chloroflexia bacterium]|nr:long-chain-fatty-acid--CoA ligase [Chloroflexia bacterium]
MELPLTPTRFLNRAAAIYPDKAAIINGEKRFTYRQYKERTNRFGHAMQDLGLARGAVIAYLGLNNHEILEAYFGVLPSGFVLLPLNVRLRPQDLAYILADAAVQALIVGPEFTALGFGLRDAVPGLKHLIMLGEDVPGHTLSYEQLLAGAASDDIAFDQIDENAVAELFYTSGTTGRPKGVELTHRNLFLHAYSCLITLGITDRDIALVGSVPLFHVNAWGTPHYMVCVGGTMSVISRFDPLLVCQAIERDRVTAMGMVPTMLSALLNCPERHKYDLSSLQWVLICGAPPPPSLIAAARTQMNVDCFVGYGLSETCPLLTVATIKSTLADHPAAELYDRKAMTGLPGVGIEIRVVDPDGHDVAPDGQQIGEILARGDNVMKGYHNLPDDTERALAGGWFHTGDLATIDAEGYLQIKDRKKDIIISGGENISSVEIEDVFYQHPAVLEAAVIAAPDDRWGEVPIALIVLKPDHTATPEELAAFAGERLPRFKHPKAVEIVPEFPKTGTGKVVKTELREKYWAGYASRVH